MNKTVLIVDDNEMNLTLAKDIVRSRGFDTLETGDAESAIEIAREKKPDLILMDVRLPGMDGLEATRLLKADEETGGLPVVAITASVFQRDREKAFDAGCDGFLNKPFRFDDFIAEIEKFLK